MWVGQAIPDRSMTGHDMHDIKSRLEGLEKSLIAKISNETSGRAILDSQMSQVLSDIGQLSQLNDSGTMLSMRVAGQLAQMQEDVKCMDATKASPLTLASIKSDCQDQQ